MRGRALDYRLFGAIGLLLAFGLLTLSSASTVVGYERFGDSYYFLKRQLLLGFLPGLVGLALFARSDYRRLLRFALPLLGLSFALLVAVLVPGLGQTHGTFARRWLDLGPVSFQASELVKLTFLIYLSAWLASHRPPVGDFRQTFLPFALTVGGVLGLIVLQPDIGTAMIVAIVAVGVYFLAGGRLTHLALLAAVGLLALFVLIEAKPHAADRLTTFLHPELDPQGIGYHINQAYLAIGSGGILGRGFGQSRAKFQYLPEVYGDSIFAVIGEEFGFVFSVAFLSLFVYLLLRGLKVSRAAPDDFGRLLGSGIILWFTGQAFVNISAMIGLLPLTGIPLPFVSYGSSALASSLWAVGVLASISRAAREV